MRTFHTHTRHLFTIAAGATLLLAACGSDDESTSTTGASGAVTVEGAWARTSPMMVTAGAAYMELTSTVDDQLVGASVDASIAGTVELHETRMAETDTSTMDTTGMSTADTAPAMEMVPVDAIELPAGEVVELAPGGYHVMLLDLPAPLETGQTFTLTLDFAQAADQQVTVTVSDEAP
jgi:copper(I)-binding protein